MLEKVIENWTSRLDYIRASRCSHMPEIILKIRSFEHHIQATVRFGLSPPQFLGRTPCRCQGPSTNLTTGLATRRVFRVPPCRKDTIHLQTSKPSPGFEPRLYGAAVSVTKHYTEWAANFMI
ncbi:hypothetical protein TNCV_1431811 [Trichonephila clavipes]|nr:hypothetical protein TNCV_1431811 [Trichonephila clavipes]